MSILLHPLVLTFLGLLLVAHLFGFCTKGKWPKSCWKAGDYIWLSMTFFALINGLSTLRINTAMEAETELRQQLILNYNNRITNLEKAQKLFEEEFSLNALDNPTFTTGLRELAEDASKIDSQIIQTREGISKNKSKKIKTEFEKNANNLYIYFLIIAFAIRITMTSAEVFNWYKE